MNSFEQNYPNISRWVKEQGWIEIGRDDYSSSMVRALDEGRMVWEGQTRYKSLDEALEALEKGLKEWMTEQQL
ncbi:MAG TPA: hypothetical protein VH186_03580 [Chloroflexia bacterium]|nr:hypothetical protein [Chloroflexia bacterium]